MKDDLERWRAFWGSQTTPLHRHDDNFFYELYADELNLIFKRFGYKGGKVLESGCGNGALFPYLKIEKNDYLGMDISPTLLEQFQSRHPQVHLIEDSAENIPDRQFELIFSNGMGQYFNEARMQSYIRNALQHLEPGGLLVIGNLLWKSAQARFLAGVYADTANQTYDQSRTLKSRLLDWLKTVKNTPDPMGYWVEPEDVLKLVPSPHNTIVGSIFHPYRFTLVTRLPDT